MAHALDESKGLEGSMVYVGQLPWHQHGTMIPAGLSVDEAVLACPAVDFNTTLVPMYYNPSTAKAGELTVDCGNFRAIIRDDTNAMLGVATDKYKPIQIRDQWAGLDPLIESGLATIETMGSINGGQRTWGLVKINASEFPFWAELEAKVGKIDTYALAMDDKTGKASAVLAPTGVRVVCQNTLEAARGGLTKCIKVRHIGDTQGKIEAAARELWGGITETFEALAARYELLKKVLLTTDEHERLVLDLIAKAPTEEAKFASKGRFEGAVARADEKRAEVSRLWTDGAGHEGDHSAWEALNAVIEATDHNTAGVFRLPRGGGKMATMLAGTEAQLKERVTMSLVGHAQAVTAMSA